MGENRNVCEELLGVLADAGARQIFGVTGDALNPLLVAIRKDKRFEWIGMRHEENAAYAAYAQSELTGGIGVCAGTTGPGALHLVNGLYNAKRERAGVVAITGQVSAAEKQTRYHQEVDLVKMFDDICSYQAVIGKAEQMPRLAQIAVQRAIYNREVVRIELPIDVTECIVPSQHFRHKLVLKPSITMPPLSEIERAVGLLNSSDRVTIFAGAGCRSARDEVLQLSQRLRAPIAHTLKGLDIFNFKDSSVVGMTGLLGQPAGFHAVKDSEVLLMLGTDFPYDGFIPSGPHVIQCDLRVENVGRRTPIEVGLVGHVQPVVSALLQRVQGKESSKWVDALVKMRDKWLAHQAKQASLDRTQEPLAPQIFAKAISDQASSDAYFGTDTGESTVWLARCMSMHGGRRIVGSGFNHGSMGGALPSALGAIALDPKREVWALCGDGSFAMAMQDFLTAVRFEWPLKVIVYNNSELSFVKMEMEVAGYAMDPAATGLTNPDFAAYAKACGGDGVRVEHAKDILPAIAQARASKKPFIIDAVVTSGELVMPPHITIKQAWGFGISKVKEALLGTKGDHEQWENLKKEFKANF